MFSPMYKKYAAEEKLCRILFCPEAPRTEVSFIC